MMTDHQQGSVSVILLTDDSSNESITCNNEDKQIVPYAGNKTDSNNSIETNSTELSNVKDNSTITFEQPNENDPFYKRILVISTKWKIYPCDLLEKIFLKQPFNA